MLNLQQKPIFEWPGALTKNRQRSNFSATYRDTQLLLERELAHLSARNIVMQVALRPQDFRLDGLPKANARPADHPGVILSFDSKHGPLSYPCDQFLDWESNLRAIAKSLEALRMVDRYGVTRKAEQYRGWTALPPPDDGFATVDAAAEFISTASGIPITVASAIGDKGRFNGAYRQAAAKLHPDQGGSESEFKKLQSAKEMIEEYCEALK